MGFLRAILLAILWLPATMFAQANPVGTWKAVFTCNTFGFVATGKDGWSVNGEYHCCPRLVFVGTIKGDEMTLTMRWTSTERPDNPTVTPLPMEAMRIQSHADFSGTWMFVPQSPAPASVFQTLWTGDPVTITQDATTITVEYMSRSRSHQPVKLVYNLDGSERENIDRNSLPNSQTRRSRASWRGAELVLTTIVPRLDTAGAPDPVETTETLSLDSPTTLLVKITRHSKALTDSTTAVYRRVTRP